MLKYSYGDKNMTVFQSIMKFLDGSMVKPQPFGWFHFLCIGLVILTTVLLCVFARKFGDKGARVVVLTYSIATILLEVYKMLNFSYNWETNTWDFQWYAFPFQFCSTPMYVGLIAGCLKKCKFQEFLYSYLASFSLLAGIAVMLMPTTVYVETIGINIQTMVCHGGMIIVGFYLYATKAVVPTIKTWLKAMAVFGVTASIAMILNLSLYKAVAPETFNMFFISPYYNCELPLLQDIQNAAPYPVFLLCYLIAMFGGALIIIMLVKLFCFLYNLIKNKIQSKNKKTA